jgi:hypothetical protein
MRYATGAGGCELLTPDLKDAIVIMMPPRLCIIIVCVVNKAERQVWSCTGTASLLAAATLHTRLDA